MKPILARPSLRSLTTLAAIAGSMLLCGVARAADPIRIGFGMALTGPLAANGKSALLAMKLWEEDTNAKGGLLGRPVKLVYYDDQSNGSTVPGIYSKLLDIDKVELVVGGYATNMLAPAMPLIMQRKKTFIGLLGLAINDEFKYPNYFSMNPAGQEPKRSNAAGFFQVALSQTPKPQSVAIVAADAEYSRNTSDGARDIATRNGLKIVYDKTYPPSTTDFAPIVRAIQASNPDAVFIASYPLDSVGFVRAVNEIGFKPKIIGGGMVGLQSTSVKTQLGPMLNGFVDYDFWLPVDTMKFPGVHEMLARYQAKAEAEGVDPLGYYMAPWSYAYVQILGMAVEATKSLEDEKLAEYIRKTTFKTVAGEIKFGDRGEWAVGRTLQVQFQGITGNGLDQFRGAPHQVILYPADLKSGNLAYPFADARK